MNVRQNNTENGALVTPEALPDGTLALPCGSLWSVADREAWRVDHLPACATCAGNFGVEVPE